MTTVSDWTRREVAVKCIKFLYTYIVPQCGGCGLCWPWLSWWLIERIPPPPLYCAVDYYAQQLAAKEYNEMWWIIALLILGNICSLITGTYESPTAATVAVVPIHGSQSVSQAVPHVTRSCPQSVSQSVCQWVHHCSFIFCGGWTMNEGCICTKSFTDRI